MPDNTKPPIDTANGASRASSSVGGVDLSVEDLVNKARRSVNSEPAVDIDISGLIDNARHSFSAGPPVDIDVRSLVDKARPAAALVRPEEDWSQSVRTGLDAAIKSTTAVTGVPAAAVPDVTDYVLGERDSGQRLIEDYKKAYDLDEIVAVDVTARVKRMLYGTKRGGRGAVANELFRFEVRNGRPATASEASEIEDRLRKEAIRELLRVSKEDGGRPGIFIDTDPRGTTQRLTREAEAGMKWIHPVFAPLTSTVDTVAWWDPTGKLSEGIKTWNAAVDKVNEEYMPAWMPGFMTAGLAGAALSHQWDPNNVTGTYMDKLDEASAELGVPDFIHKPNALGLRKLSDFLAAPARELPDSVADLQTAWKAAAMPYDQEVYVPVQMEDGQWDYKSGALQGGKGFAGNLAYFFYALPVLGGTSNIANWLGSGGEWASEAHIDHIRKMHSAADYPAFAEYTDALMNPIGNLSGTVASALGVNDYRQGSMSILADFGLGLVEPDVLPIAGFVSGSAARKTGDFIGDALHMSVAKRVERGQEASDRLADLLEKLSHEDHVNFRAAVAQGKNVALDPAFTRLTENLVASPEALREIATMVARMDVGQRTVVQNAVDTFRRSLTGYDAEKAAAIAWEMEFKALLAADRPVEGIVLEAAKQWRTAQNRLNSVSKELSRLGIYGPDGAAAQTALNRYMFYKAYSEEIKVAREWAERLTSGGTKKLTKQEFDDLSKEAFHAANEYRLAEADLRINTGLDADVTKAARARYEAARRAYHLKYNNLMRRANSAAATIFERKVTLVTARLEDAKNEIEKILESMDDGPTRLLAQKLYGSAESAAVIARGQANANALGLAALAARRTSERFAAARRVLDSDFTEVKLGKLYKMTADLAKSGSLTPGDLADVLRDIADDGTFVPELFGRLRAADPAFVRALEIDQLDVSHAHRILEMAARMRRNRDLLRDDGGGGLILAVDRMLESSTLRTSFASIIRANVSDIVKAWNTPAALTMPGNARMLQIQKGAVDQARYINWEFGIVSQRVGARFDELYSDWYRRASAAGPVTEEAKIRAQRAIDTRVKVEEATRYVESVERIDAETPKGLFRKGVAGGTVINTLDNADQWTQFREYLRLAMATRAKADVIADPVFKAIARSYIPRGVEMGTPVGETPALINQLEAAIYDGFSDMLEHFPGMGFADAMEQVVEKNTSMVIFGIPGEASVKSEKPIAFVFSSQAVAYGALLSRTLKQIRSEASGFSDADIAALAMLEAGQPGRLTPAMLERAGAAYQAMGLTPRQVKVRLSQADVIDRSLKPLIKDDLLLPDSTLKDILRPMERIIKDPAALNTRNEDVLNNGISRVFTNTASMMKIGMLTGYLLPKVPYLTSNLTGNAAAAWSVAGPVVQARSNMAVLADIPRPLIENFQPWKLASHIPYVGARIDRQLERTANKFRTNFPLPGAMSSHANHHLNLFVRGSGDQKVVGRSGRVYTIRELRALAASEGVFVSQAQAELQDLMLRHRPTGMRGWKLFSKLDNSELYLDVVQSVEQRQRSALFLDLIVNEGLKPSDAGKVTRKALYDWNHAATKAELAWLGSMPLFYRYLRVAHQQGIEILLEPFAAGYRGGMSIEEAVQKSIPANGINGSAWHISNTRSLSDIQQAFMRSMNSGVTEDETEEQLLARRGPAYAGNDTRGSYAYAPLDVQARAWIAQQGGHADAYRFMMPAAGTLETLGTLVTAAQTLAGVASMPLLDNVTENDVSAAHTLASASNGFLEWAIDQGGPLHSKAAQKLLEYAQGKSSFAGLGVRIAPGEAALLNTLGFGAMGLVYTLPEDEEGVYRANAAFMDVWRLLPILGSEANMYMRTYYNSGGFFHAGDYAKGSAVLLGSLTGVAPAQLYDAQRRTLAEQKYTLKDAELRFKRALEANGIKKKKAEENDAVYLP